MNPESLTRGRVLPMAEKELEPLDGGSPRSEPEYPAPDLPYRPRDPNRLRGPIGLIGCGGITVEHLTAYRKAGYDVVALCDLVEDCANDRQQTFYPAAQVYTDYRDVLARDDILVVDVATHPPGRAEIIEAALRAGKHVLSQKPFVLDLDEGESLADVADRHGVRLAVNQNARWAPHFSYMRHAVAAGLVGEVDAVQFSVNWDHNWVAGTPFDDVPQLILYDFAIHWFDMTCCLMGAREAVRVYASNTRSPGQRARPPLLAQALVEYHQAQASLVFNGNTKFGPYDMSYVVGSRGTLISSGASFRQQQLSLCTADGVARPQLEGSWFPDGFHGTMADLLAAIEEDREPTSSARDNLKSLALCFAAVASAERHEPVHVGSVRRMPGA